MKRLFLILSIFTCMSALAADVKISQLPLGAAATTNINDSFPYVSTATGVTKRLTLYDIANIPSIAAQFAALSSSPHFTGTVQADGGFIGNLTGNVTGNVTGNLTGNVTGVVTGSLVGNASTATALAANPADCSSGQYANTIAANGDLTCAQVQTTQLGGTITNSQLAGSITASKLVGTDIATLGTVTAGTWNATVISPTYGGTGQTSLSAAFTALYETVATTLGDMIYGGASGAPTRLAGNTTTTPKFLKSTGSGSAATAPAWTQAAFSDLSGSATAAQMPAFSGDVSTSAGSTVTTIGANKVTNSMLAGSIAASKLVGTDIATVGTITSGTWNGTVISEVYGGTNQSSYTLGDTLYASASNTLSKLAGNTTTTKKYLSQTGNGTVSAAPSWAQVAFSDLSGSASASQMPAFSGDVSTSAGSTTTTIGANKVTNSMLSTVSTATFKGRTTAGTGNVEDLTATQATALLNAVVGDSGSGGTKGLVPAPASGDAAALKYLKADGTWSTVSATVTQVAPTVQRLTSGTSATYNKNYAFIISSGSATAGATYTNNSVTFTVYETVSSGTLVYMSGSGAPTSSGTLTKASGTGDSSLTFSQVIAPLYLEIEMVGGGGGGAGSTTGAATTGGTGGNTSFGSNLTAGGGAGGNANDRAAGGTCTFTSATGLRSIAALTGAGSAGSVTSLTGTNSGSGGGVSPFGGAGQPGGGTNSLAGLAAVSNTGSGGGGGSTVGGTYFSGSGGGAGCYIHAIQAFPAATYTYTIGAGGSGGTGSGASKVDGGAGGSGVVIVTEHYQ